MLNKKSFVIFFVEGETEKEFYEALIKFYRDNSKGKIGECKVYNIKGISRFENKVTSKLKFEILPKHFHKRIIVICCYDSDVFDLAQKPPINWKIVKNKAKDLGAFDFIEVKAIKMIEDWFLKDIKGLCKYLNIENGVKLEGKNGYEKIKTLFKKGNKIYQKGNGVHKFIQYLNIHIIRNELKKELLPIEKALGVIMEVYKY